MSITAAECRIVTEAVLAEVPAHRRAAAVAVEVMLYGCPVEGAPCPRSLVARSGRVTVEFSDGDKPLAFEVSGPPEAPRLVETEGFWLRAFFPESRPAGGPGPFGFDVGHCGLTHSVDFDGSHWVLFGEIDTETYALIGNDSGQIRLLAPSRAEYTASDGARIGLARFPGPRFLAGCR